VAVDGGRGDADVGRDAGGADGGGSDDGGAIDAGGEADGGADGGARDGGDDAGPADAGILVDASRPDTGSDAGPVSCTTDADCPSGTFCRDRMAGGRECVPFTMEGDPCGGFVPVWAVTRCEPGTGCVPVSPLIADAPGRCATAATVTEIRAMPSRYDGRFVAVLTGWVLGGPAGCTRIACPPAMPCCNMCNSGEILAENMTDTTGIGLRDMAAMPYTCMGDECMPYATCTVAPNAQYRIMGWYRAAGDYIEVHSILAIP
jgi:Cys-rich repeat protein